MNDYGGPRCTVENMRSQLGKATSNDLGRCYAVHPEHRVQCVKELGHVWRGTLRGRWHSGVVQAVPRVKTAEWVEVEG